MTKGEIEAVDQVAAALKGRDIILDVTTAAGTRFIGRRLNNVTLTRTSVKGFDPLKNAVRCFSLDKIERMVLAPDQTLSKEAA